MSDASAEVVYSSHMMAYLSRKDALRFLAEARRVLAPGGSLRLVLPDLRIQAERYLSSGDADAFVAGTYLAFERPATVLARLRFLLVGNHTGHAWMYDGVSVLSLLKSAGFLDAQLVEPGQTRIREPGPLDLFERKGESLYAEATR